MESWWVTSIASVRCIFGEPNLDVLFFGVHKVIVETSVKGHPSLDLEEQRSGSRVFNRSFRS